MGSLGTYARPNVDGEIYNSFSVGSVKAVSGYYPGGLAGYHGKIAECYSISHVEGNRPGAIGGYTDGSTASISNCYWNDKTSGLTSSNGLQVQYQDLFKQATYQNWDFDNIWQIEEGKTTPYLKWLGKIEEITKDYLDNNS